MYRVMQVNERNGKGPELYSEHTRESSAVHELNELCRLIDTDDMYFWIEGPGYEV